MQGSSFKRRGYGSRLLAFLSNLQHRYENPKIEARLSELFKITLTSLDLERAAHMHNCALSRAKFISD